ncbi:2-isopropylmalate synthase [PVC group bacterium]|nr:2-isopropylmalate synthase [PVC group bacterium]
MEKKDRQPFFYDVTLRDGNQALRRPWNTAEKEVIFRQLLRLGVQAVEVGFSGASDMDFEACQHLAKIAKNENLKDIEISGLARTVERDIKKVYDAIHEAPKPRIHTFIGLSPFAMEHVLKLKSKEVQKKAIEAVRFAKSLLGKKGRVEFSAEHFGDCADNLDFVIETFLGCIEAGASVINLPNTVERTRPSEFIELVQKAADALPKDSVMIAVHTHNDLGMATATTVESYFAGATQLECCLNGLGERAGNTNLFEVAVALHCSGVNVPLNMNEIYETSLLISEMSGVPIYEKAPLVGSDALAHRSGIHQDGTAKTKDMKKGAYRSFDPTLIGLEPGELITFTSQSGKTAICEIIQQAGWPISIKEAVYLQPFMKSRAEEVGELKEDEVFDVYFKKLFHVDGNFEFHDFFEIVKQIPSSKEKSHLEFYRIKYSYDKEKRSQETKGDGPIDACLNAIREAGFQVKLLHYEQKAVQKERKGSASDAMTVIKLKNDNNGEVVICRGLNPDTRAANIEAIFNGLNLLGL